MNAIQYQKVLEFETILHFALTFISRSSMKNCPINPRNRKTKVQSAFKRPWPLCV